MFSFGEVVVDVVTDLVSCHPMVFVFGHFQFGFDRSEARFHEGIVVAVVGAVHALAERGPSQQSAIPCAGVLAAAIGVVDQIGGRLSLTDRHPQRREYEIFRHGFVEIPTYHRTRITVHQYCQITETATMKRDVGNVTDPQFIDFRRCRRVQQQVGTVPKSVPTVGGFGHKRFRLNRS